MILVVTDALASPLETAIGATRRIADKGIVEVGNGGTPPMSLDGGAKSVLLSTNQQLRHHSQLDRCEACSNNIVYCSNE